MTALTLFHITGYVLSAGTLVLLARDLGLLLKHRRHPDMPPDAQGSFNWCVLSALLAVDHLIEWLLGARTLDHVFLYFWFFMSALFLHMHFRIKSSMIELEAIKSRYAPSHLSNDDE